MKNSNLKFKKETIANLNNDEMDNLKGGFTYSLSMGARCIKSKNAERLEQDITERANCKASKHGSCPC